MGPAQVIFFKNCLRGHYRVSRKRRLKLRYHAFKADNQSSCGILRRRKEASFQSLRIPPNGSWGIVQIQPTKQVQVKPWNPPNGSWGIVHRRIMNGTWNSFERFISEARSEQSTNFRWWDLRTRSARSHVRLDLNNPPTSIGGFQNSVRGLAGEHGPSS